MHEESDCEEATVANEVLVDPPSGKFESGLPDDAVIRLYLTADGTMIRAEGKRGGNWEGQTVFDSIPSSLGEEIADITLWKHDGTETDVANEDGTPAHVHSGLTNPPWGSHCHRWIRIGSHHQWEDQTPVLSPPRDIEMERYAG